MTKGFEKYARNSTILSVGGFRPPEDSRASFFGQVLVALPGEFHPLDNDGKKMVALCQLNLAQLGCSIPNLSAEFISIFVSQDITKLGPNNGDNWVIRTYESASALVPTSYTNEFPIKSFPIRKECEMVDWPCFEENIDIPDEISDDYEDDYPNQDKFKIGGWPSLVQGHLSVEGELVVQIPTEYKANWAWGDNGVGYFLIDSNGSWHMQWQTC